MNYDIRSLYLKSGTKIVCNVLIETSESFFIHVYDTNSKLDYYHKNGDEVYIHKDLLLLK